MQNSYVKHEHFWWNLMFLLNPSKEIDLPKLGTKPKKN
jgi:hypothetical protein